MEMDPGQKEECWLSYARQAFIKMKNHLFLLSSKLTYDQRNYESWLGAREMDTVPDDAAFVTAL